MNEERLQALAAYAPQPIISKAEWLDVLSLAADGIMFRRLSEQGHVAEFTVDGRWSLEHPVTCRIEARMLDCPVNVAIDGLPENPFGEPGRYRVIVGDTGVLEGWKLPLTSS